MDVVEFDRSLEKGARTLILAVWKHKLVFVLTGFVVFTLWMGLSRFGDIKLGKDDDEPRRWRPPSPGSSER